MDQERVKNKARYTSPPVEYFSEEPKRTSQELDDYNHEVVKKLCYMMFDRSKNGERVTDFGSVQYKYLEMWGVIEIDSYKKNIKKATIIARSDNTDQFGRPLKNTGYQDNIESVAKLITLIDFYRQVRESGQTIQMILNF